MTHAYRLSLALLCFLCAMAHAPVMAQSAQSAAGVALPKPARKLLDEKWKGWQLASVDPQATACRQDGQSPAFVQTDFDGDGRADIALAVKIASGVRLVAIMNRMDDSILYDIDSLGDSAATRFLSVERHGTKFTNPLTMLEDYFPTDTLSTSRCSQGRSVYFWAGTGFRKLEIR